MSDHPPGERGSFKGGKFGDITEDHAAILDCDRNRCKRNLLPCREEDAQAELWMRTADVLAAEAARTGGADDLCFGSGCSR